jgi:uncharacterized phage-associated protein
MDDNEKVFGVANYILDTLDESKISITNLKLQKLLYFAYGINLFIYNVKLFNSPIQAWSLGPIIPEVYKEFKNYREDNITTRACILQNDESGNIFLAQLDTTDQHYKDNIRSLDIVCATYVHRKANELINITHRKDSAWYSVWHKNFSRDNKDNRERYVGGRVIPDEDIVAEFDLYADRIVRYLWGEK